MSLWSVSLGEFREQVASNAPVPGCGAVTCVSAGLGLALVLKALRNAQGKKPDKARGAVIEEAERLSPVIAAHADADVRSFGAYIDELVCECEGPAEQRTLDVTLGSLAAARSCLAGMHLADEAKPLVSAFMRADIMAGALLLHASLMSLLVNVAIDGKGECSSAGEGEDPYLAIQALQAAADKLMSRIRSA